MDREVLFQARDIHKAYSQGASVLEILRGVDFEIKAGEACAIVGVSGAGKSTLLQILGTLDRPDKGEIMFRGQSLVSCTNDEIARTRNKEIGFVFQFHHLISELTAIENVMLPARIAGEPLKFSRRQAEALLEKVGLSERMEHYPHQLSGGELQRVAIARALISKPRLLLADEPTGNLDSQTSESIQNLFFDLQQSLGLAMVVVTHEMSFAQRFPRVLRMKDGQFV